MRKEKRFRCDVLVVGAGPSGLAAAIAAARAGAETLIIEKEGFPGGMATGAFVANFTAFFSGGRRVVGGIGAEICERLIASGGAAGIKFVQLSADPTLSFDRLEFDPEVMKFVADEMLGEAGVRALYGLRVTEALADGGALCGALALGPEDTHRVDARVTIDATGDGGVATRAEAPWKLGGNEGTVQAASLNFRMGPVDFERAGSIKRSRWEELVDSGIREGRLFARYLAIHGPIGSADAIVNATRVPCRDPLSAECFSKAHVEGRCQVRAVSGYLIERYPGFERARLLSVAPFLGVRESRRVMGDYVLTAKDVLEARGFEDSIGLGCYAIDLHETKSLEVKLKRVPEGGAYSIPYRCLLPRGLEGALVAGRAISSEREAYGSLRAMSVCAVTGQAAGAAAALAAKEGVPPRALEVQAIRNLLRQQGAILELDDA